MIAAIAFGLSLSSADASAARPKGKSKRSGRVVSPAVFGDVFRSSRGAMVRVSGGDPKEDNAALWTGFVIGARGEVVFGAKRAPAPDAALKVFTLEGIAYPARLLGFDAGLRLGVAQMLREDGTPSLTEPLRPSRNPGLVANAWVVVLQHDSKGLPEPYAGLVERDARPLLGCDGAARRSKKACREPDLSRAEVAPVAAPGALGSPVLSVEGELVGVVFEEGRRKMRALTFESVVPFLRQVVIGS